MWSRCKLKTDNYKVKTKKLTQENVALRAALTTAEGLHFFVLFASFLKETVFICMLDSAYSAVTTDEELTE